MDLISAVSIIKKSKNTPINYVNAMREYTANNIHE